MQNPIIISTINVRCTRSGPSWVSRAQTRFKGHLRVAAVRSKVRVSRSAHNVFQKNSSRVYRNGGRGYLIKIASGINVPNFLSVFLGI